VPVEAAPWGVGLHYLEVLGLNNYSHSFRSRIALRDDQMGVNDSR